MSEKVSLTHDELVKIGERYLMATKKCLFAFAEMGCPSISEIPDVLGFQHHYSYLVECKVSRADFLADRGKKFRRMPFMGMGTHRYFLCPTGVIKPEDLPANWGLIWVDAKRRPRQIVAPVETESNIKAERHMLVTAMRRLHLRGVMPLIYEGPIGMEKKKPAAGTPDALPTGFDLAD